MGAQPSFMRDDSERLFYLGAGPLAAIVLGMALVPLRDLTHASNFTFAFLILSIVVAELGGRGPGLLTALASALSLDFFLTQPYLRLSIAAKDDVIAFVGLGVCGLVAAALGSSRRDRPEPESASRERLEFLHEAIGELETSAPLEPALTRILGAARGALGLSGAVVRDAAGEPLASADPSDRVRAAPTPGTFGGLAPIPGGALRVALTAGGLTVGFLDVWGDGRVWDAEARRTLNALTSLLGLYLQARIAGAARA